MRKRKALALVAVSAIAASAKIGLADTSLFTTRGDFGGSAAVGSAIDNGYYGFVGGTPTEPNIGGTVNGSSNAVPTAASLAAGQETGNEGWGYYDGNGSIKHINANYNSGSADSQSNPLVFNSFSLGSAGGTVNGLGHFANDYAATKYPTSPNATTSPTGPFNTVGSDPNLGKSYVGNTGLSGSMTIQGYEGATEGEGYDVIDTGEMINTNSTAATGFISAIATGTCMAIDFTAPGGGTTLVSDGLNASPYYILAWGTYDSNGVNGAASGLNTNAAGGLTTGAGSGYANPSTTLTGRDSGSYNDAAGAFIVTHGSGASSYWTAYIPYNYTGAATATFLQMALFLNSDGYSSGANGNVTIDNIRTVSPTWAASGTQVTVGGNTYTNNSWNLGATIAGGYESAAGNWVGAAGNGLTGVPSGSGVSVTFGDLETGNASVGLDTNQTVGTLIFNSTGNNTLLSGAPVQYNLTASTPGLNSTAGGTLIMDNTVNSASAAINLVAGSATEYITAPVKLNSNTVVTVASSKTLFFGSATNGLGNTVGGISGTGSLTVSGAGTVQLAYANTYAGGTTVSTGATLTASTDNGLPSGHALVNNGITNMQGSTTLSSLTGTGVLNISPGSDTQSVVKLAVNSGNATEGGVTIAANSALDMTNNQLIYDYTGSSATADTTVRDYLINGRGGSLAPWNGNGVGGIGGVGAINTSGSTGSGVDSGYALGYADGAEGVVAGLTSGQMEVRYTLLGDALLNGSVTGNDFTILVGNLGKSFLPNGNPVGWDDGDFEYSSSVNGNDFTDLVGNLGKSATLENIQLPAADWVAVDAYAAANGITLSNDDVPEPASAGLLLVAGVGMLARRRRSRSS